MKKFKSKIAVKTLAVTTAMAVLVPVAASGAAGSIGVSAATTGDFTKEETVYVNTDATGSVETETVSNWLHCDTSGATVNDVANLTDIKNVEGSEVPTISGSNVTWTLNGTDLYYQGTTTESLPVSMSIKYYLDGEEISASDLAGKSGKVEIKISFKNNDAHTVNIGGNAKTLYTPFACATGFDLPKKYFSNVTTNFGEVVSDGSNQIVSYISVPGLEDDFDMLNLDDYVDFVDEFDITADATDFQLGPIMAAVTPVPDLDSLKDSHTIDDLLDKLDDLYDAGSELRDASGALNSGEKAFTKGIKKLLAGITTADDSFDEIIDGADTLSSSSASGISSLSSGTKSLSSGAKQLSAGLSKLLAQFEDGSSSNQTLKYSVDSLTTGSAKITAGLKSLLSQFSAGKDGTTTLYDNLNELNTGGSSYVSLVNNTLFGIVSSEVSTLYSISPSNYTNYLGAQAAGIKATADTYVAEAVTSGSSSALQTAAVYANIYNVLNSAVGVITDSSISSSSKETAFENALLSGATNSPSGYLYQFSSSDITDSSVLAAYNSNSAFAAACSSTATALNAKNAVVDGKSISSGLSELFANMKTAASGSSDTLYDSVSQLYSGSAQVSGGLSQFDTQMVTSGDSDNPSLYDSVKSLSSGASELSDGASALYEGTSKLGALQTGINKLVSGLSIFKSGLSSIEGGTSTLYTNSKKLSAGTSKLYSGMDEFFTKGLSKLNGSERNDISDALEVKDALINLADNYTTFSGAGKDIESSVKFVIETDEIKVSSSSDTSAASTSSTTSSSGSTSSSASSSSGSSRNIFQIIGDWLWNLFH